jgi:predicted kinase
MESKYNKSIIVIGKMGSGKSSFIKMLVIDPNIIKLKANEELHTVTKECTSY